MNWFEWTDLITPTNPVAAMFFGIVFSVIIGLLFWVETKEVKSVIYSVAGAIGLTLLIVGSLYLIGFYAI